MTDGSPSLGKLASPPDRSGSEPAATGPMFSSGLDSSGSTRLPVTLSRVGGVTSVGILVVRVEGEDIPPVVEVSPEAETTPQVTALSPVSRKSPQPAWLLPESLEPRPVPPGTGGVLVS